MSLCSQVLLLPLGVPPMRAPAMLPISVIPMTVKFGGPPPPMWEHYHVARGFRRRHTGGGGCQLFRSLGD